jgi:hypothetical protein
MNTYAVMLNCQGDNEHEPHSEPMIIISIAENLEDSDKLLPILLLLSTLNSEDSVDEIEMSPEEIMRTGDLIASALKLDNIEDIDPFDGIKELDDDVEFPA